MEITKAEFDGLGNRTNKLREEFIECRASKEAELTAFKETVAALATNQNKIFEMLNAAKDTIATLSGGIRVWGIVLGIAAPLIAGIVAAIITKVL